jgi:DNA-binding transcriptional ArsR family regulator
MESQLNTNEVFRALADPTRRAILGRLRAGRQPVGSLARSFPVSRPAISKHLRILREAKLVIDQKQGRERFCELNVEPLRQVDQWLDEYRRFWAVNLERLKSYVESTEQ